jgi:hypothetical protein
MSELDRKQPIDWQEALRDLQGISPNTLAFDGKSEIRGNSNFPGTGKPNFEIVKERKIRLLPILGL